MANGLASLAAARTALPQTLLKGNQQDGEIRQFYSTYVVPATGAPAVGEFISWGFLPRGARVMFGQIVYSGGSASSGMSIGDPANATRYSGIFLTNAAGSTNLLPPFPNSPGQTGFEVDVVQPGLATDHSEVRGVVAGATLGAGQIYTLWLFYAANN